MVVGPMYRLKCFIDHPCLLVYNCRKNFVRRGELHVVALKQPMQSISLQNQLEFLVLHICAVLAHCSVPIMWRQKLHHVNVILFLRSNRVRLQLQALDAFTVKSADAPLTYSHCAVLRGLRRCAGAATHAAAGRVFSCPWRRGYENRCGRRIRLHRAAGFVVQHEVAPPSASWHPSHVVDYCSSAVDRCSVGASVSVAELFLWAIDCN